MKVSYLVHLTIRAIPDQLHQLKYSCRVLKNRHKFMVSESTNTQRKTTLW